MSKKGQILIVEDEAITAMLLQRQLSQMGYGKPIIVATGEEAVRVAAQSKPAVVLMDINLAGEIDGIEAASRIGKEYDVPIAFVTGYADSDIRRRAEALSPVAYLLKPASPADLVNVIAPYVAKTAL